MSTTQFTSLFNAAREQIAERLNIIRRNEFGDYTPEDLESAELERAQIECDIATVLALTDTSTTEAPTSRRDPADAVGNMRRIVELDAQEQSPVDEPMLSTMAALVGQLPAVLDTLDWAGQALAALDNILLNPRTRDAMTTADQQGRDKLADELRAHLFAIGA